MGGAVRIPRFTCAKAACRCHRSSVTTSNAISPTSGVPARASKTSPIRCAPMRLPGRRPRKERSLETPTWHVLIDCSPRVDGDAFYEGTIARTIDAYFKRIGGWLSYEDLRDQHAEWGDPLVTSYRGVDVYAMAANTQGLATLQMLNILENFDLRGMGFQSAASIHVQAEAKRLAYEDRARYYADPHFATIPISWLNSKTYAAERAKLIRPDTILTPAYPGQAPSHGDTTYFTVADAGGMMVSMIQSNFRGMGSGLVGRRPRLHVSESRPAILAHGRTSERIPAGEASLPDHHSGILDQRRTAVDGIRVMGGDMQPQGQAQIVIDRIDYGLDIQAAGDSPRWHHEGSSQSMGEDVAGLGPRRRASPGSRGSRGGAPQAHRVGLAHGSLGWRVRALRMHRTSHERLDSRVCRRH